ncbi:peroxisome biogenesis protein 22 isoform X3 [Elaeis guineensis]|uniref:Peroxisome biogenesis protein 22 isoform X4 n=1 Tax=Elaeis guineensis var. tenera TaxID=51953 RepID=A0A6I9RSM7_ELAGV|nr:peroxisome biogenesis protein 22 isoform X4 [Elaeis guineensis]XP_010931842.1 peroxisome biogenesis protein 22 isoform X5 [Elaeis guineensis]
MAESVSSAAKTAKEEELADLIQRFMASLAELSERLPFTVDRQKLRSITTLAAFAIALVFAWKLLRAPTDQQRRQRRRHGSNGLPNARAPVPSSELCSSSADSRVQDVVDEFFQPVKLTLEQVVRHKLSEGRKVTCRLLGVILEETTPEELQGHATVKSSVLEVLLEITKFCDVYLMERILDDESGVLFCSTENGRISFVRQLEPDWHIDTNPEIIHQLARFIKYELHVTPNRPERTASNVFSSESLEQFFGDPVRR